MKVGHSEIFPLLATIILTSSIESHFRFAMGGREAKKEMLALEKIFWNIFWGGGWNSSKKN